MSRKPHREVNNPNVFVASQSYYIYVLYSKPSLHQTYSLYIGTGLSQAAAFATVTTGIVTPWDGLPITFAAGTFNGSPDWIQSKTYNATTGVLSVTMDLGEQTSVFSAAQADSCQPASYCSVHSDGSCGCKPGSSCTGRFRLLLGNKEIDCPSAGCFGFSVTLPSTFQTATAAQPIPPPAPVLFRYPAAAILTSAPETSSSTTSPNPSPASSVTTQRHPPQPCIRTPSTDTSRPRNPKPSDQALSTTAVLRPKLGSLVPSP